MNNKKNRLIRARSRTETAKNAERERTRVKSLRDGFQRLQSSLPSVPRDTKLSKLDVLILATNYISHLGKIIEEPEKEPSTEQTNALADKYFHPVKKWPMRSRLYAGQDTLQTDEQSHQHDLHSAESTNSASTGSTTCDVSQDVVSTSTSSYDTCDWESLLDVTFDHNLVSSMSCETAFNFDDFIN